MIAFLDTSSALETCATEIGDGVRVGQLLTPLTRFVRRSDVFAIDNGAYAGLDVNGFRSLLKREHIHRGKCRFVAAPDVPFSGRRTLEVFRHWLPELRKDGWPVALVAQNGMGELDIPWGEIRRGAIFIGGDDEFKDGIEAASIIRAAIAMGIWVHVGRVNGPERIVKLLKLFKRCDDWSIDGSGISQYTHMRKKLGRAIRGEPLDGMTSMFETAEPRVA